MLEVGRVRRKALFFLVLPIVLLATQLPGENACGSARKGVQKVREPQYADMFYPGSERRLENMVDSLLEEAGQKIKHLPELPEGRIVALISPHAGLVYSGATAALGYRILAKQKLEKVIVLGVRHRGYPPGATIEKVDGYLTPLGVVPLAGLAEKFIDTSTFSTAPDDDHSLEVQLPLLQRALKGFELVPIIIGEMPPAEMVEAATALSETLDDQETVLIASGDFTHYGYRFRYTPFGHPENLPDKIRDLDMGAVEKILAIDPEGFVDYVGKTGATICGRKTITMLLHTLKKRPGIKGVLLEYTTSGKLTGDWSNSVSYASIVFVETASQRGSSGDTKKEKDSIVTAEQSGGSPEIMEPENEEFTLSKQQKQVLIRVARETLEVYINKGQVPEIEVNDPLLNEKCGAFVTLHGGVSGSGNLRGCIGYTEGVKPLVQTIQDMAVAASTKDYRFPPVSSSELDKIDIEISVLTPLKQEKNHNNIVMGKHGVIVRKGMRHQGVFLPQVATETGWSKEEFMGQLCSQKAGLPREAWREPDTDLFTFTAIVFGEKDFE